MRLVRFHELATVHDIPFTRVHINRLIKAGQFPAPVRLGEHTIAWINDEIIAWKERARAERDERQARREARDARTEPEARDARTTA
jgi:prophage regulatory protein